MEVYIIELVWRREKSAKNGPDSFITPFILFDPKADETNALWICLEN
jgi:hypothetical protein